MIQVPGVGVQTIALVEPIPIPMKRIAPAFADQGDLPARSSVERRVCIRHSDLELFQAFYSSGNEVLCVGTSSNRVVRDVDSIQQDGILIAARASHRASGIPEGSVRRAA